MKRAVAWAAWAALSVGLTGCSVLRTVHVVQRTVPPSSFQTADEGTLQQAISSRDAAIKTLKATVLITASTGGGNTGKVTEYTALKGYIFVRKPHDLNVIMQLPLFGSQAIDMVSDADRFKLLINFPTVHRAIEGSNEVSKPSKNGLENLRPSVFFDSLLVPGVAPDEFVSMTQSQRIIPPASKHGPALEEPDYDLAVLKVREGHLMHLSRLIHINRVNLLPVEQDIYDEQGRVVTITTYDKYGDYNGQKFPALINIRRPLDQYSLKIEITKLALNEPLEDDQFTLDIPAGVPVEKLE